MTKDEALKWIVDFLTDGDPLVVPYHVCEFAVNPSKGTCKFHETWTDILQLTGSIPHVHDEENDGSH